MINSSILVDNAVSNDCPLTSFNLWFFITAGIRVIMKPKLMMVNDTSCQVVMLPYSPFIFLSFN
jgi:hypothetical protein